MKIALIDSVKHGACTIKDTTWEEVVAMLSTRVTVVEKEDAPLWSPSEYQTARRSNNVLAVHFGVLDFDGITDIDLVGLIEWLKVKKIAGVVHSTWRDSIKVVGNKRYARLVVPFNRPAQPWEWPSVWTTLNESSGGLADQQCKDIARSYYLPAMRSEWHPHRVFCNMVDGQPFYIGDAP